jgi:hypothetical protein
MQDFDVRAVPGAVAIIASIASVFLMQANPPTAPSQTLVQSIPSSVVTATSIAFVFAAVTVLCLPRIRPLVSIPRRAIISVLASLGFVVPLIVAVSLPLGSATSLVYGVLCAVGIFVWLAIIAMIGFRCNGVAVPRDKDG